MRFYEIYCALGSVTCTRWVKKLGVHPSSFVDCYGVESRAFCSIDAARGGRRIAGLIQSDNGRRMERVWRRVQNAGRRATNNNNNLNDDDNSPVTTNGHYQQDSAFISAENGNVTGRARPVSQQFYPSHNNHHGSSSGQSSHYLRQNFNMERSRGISNSGRHYPSSRSASGGGGGPQTITCDCKVQPCPVHPVLIRVRKNQRPPAPDCDCPQIKNQPCPHALQPAVYSRRYKR